MYIDYCNFLYFRIYEYNTSWHVADLLSFTLQEFTKAFYLKTNDQMLVVYLASLIRSVVALHNLINNKISNRDAEKKEGQEKEEGKKEKKDDKEKKDEKDKDKEKAEGAKKDEKKKKWVLGAFFLKSHHLHQDRALLSAPRFLRMWVSD